ncbi:MAG TPA: EpsG family protein [Opitutus sp.]|nr:EpsG family protein [Opitutus sp.]
MLPYWFLFSIVAAGALDFRRRAAAGMRAAPFLVPIGLLTALMIGFRYEVGGDWFNYLGIMERTETAGLGELLEIGDPGYMLLNWIATRLGLSIWAVNLSCGLIFSWGLIRFARRQPNPWLAVLVAIPYLVIVVAMGYSRQGVAIGIILAGLATLDRSTVARFAVYILFAASFHKSAVIILPLVALAAARQRIVIVGLLGVTAILLYWLFVQSSFDRMVTNYIEAEYSSQGAAIRVAMNMPPALLFLMNQRRFGFTPQQHKLWRNFAFAAIFAFTLLLFTDATAAVDRIALYLIPLQLAIFASLPEAFPSGGRANAQIALFVIIYSAAIQFVWLNYANHAEYWLPYQIFPLTET